MRSAKVNLSSAVTEPSYRRAGRPAKLVALGSEDREGAREKLALVIPALREAANLGGVLRRVCTVLESAEVPWEVIVVDDHSNDGTEEVVAAIARKDARVRLLVRRGVRGLSGAILHGWQHTDATILGAMDADGQHPAEVLPALLASIQSGQDVAIGSRYAGGRGGGLNPVRRLISMAAVRAARPVQRAGLRVSDPLSGFFLVRRDCVQDVAFQTKGFKLLLEILARGRVASVEEIPFTLGHRRAGRSKLTIKVAWDYVALLARLYRGRWAMAERTQAVAGD